MATPNINLPTVPSGQTNLSIAFNETVQALDALVQIGIEGFASTPPSTTLSDLGKMWIVGPTPTGSFIGYEDDLALCVGENLFVFYEAGSQIKYFLNKLNGGFYSYNSAWVQAGGLSDAPSDGKIYGRKDGSWEETSNSSADSVTYDNSATDLDAENVQEAIDEIVNFLGEMAVGTPTSTAGDLILDCANHRDFIVTLTENVTVSVTNVPNGVATEIDVSFVQGGSGNYTVTFPASFKALGNSDTEVAPTVGAVTELVAKSKDGGTTWRYAMQESA